MTVTSSDYFNQWLPNTLPGTPPPSLPPLEFFMTAQDIWVTYTECFVNDEDYYFNIEAVFLSELDALRHAVNNGFKIKKLAPGEIMPQLEGEPQREANDG